MTLPLIPTRSQDTKTWLQRASETINDILTFRFDDWRTRTAAEIAAGVYPINSAYPPGDIRRYGAKGDGVTVDTVAIQSTITVAGIAGGAVYIPAGTFITRSLTVPSNVEIFGDGYSSLLKRDPSWTGNSTNVFLIGSDAGAVSNVTIRNLRIDMNGANSFARLIQLGQSNVDGTVYTVSNVRLLDLRFMDSAPFASTGDKWAILWRANLENIWIERCHSSDDMQLTAGGTDILRNVTIQNCKVYDGRANGIAVSIGRDNHVVEALRIIGNHIECEALCIFLGPDAIYAANTGGVWRDLVISNNVCLTNPDGSSQITWFGIYLNATDSHFRDVVISNNLIWCKDTLDSQKGIRLVDENAYGTVVDTVTISANTIRNCRYGIDIANGGGVLIDSNTIVDCADGVFIDNVSEPSVISDNTIRGGTRAINIINGEVLLTGNNCPGGSGQTGSFAGRLTLTPDTGDTADVLAIGNKFTDGSSATSIYGVYRSGSSGTATLRLIDNDLTGNDAAVDNITPTLARGNIGYVTSNGGVTGSITTGTTVSHGLSVTPDVVLVTALSAGPTDIYVTTIGTTTFTINFGGGGSHTFAWEARDTTNF